MGEFIQIVRIKLADGNGHGNDLGTQSVYNILNKASDESAVHPYLQYLEESAIDLVCLMTDLDMPRCDTIRDAWNIGKGAHCDCWKGAYMELYCSNPEVEDGWFSACPGDDLSHTIPEGCSPIINGSQTQSSSVQDTVLSNTHLLASSIGFTAIHMLM